MATIIFQNVSHRLLRISLQFKSLFALTEIIGGGLFYFVSQRLIVNFVFAVTQNELSEDPRDIISRYLVAWSHSSYLSTQHFVAFYLLSHGIVKMAVIIGLLRGKSWAYPSSLIVFTAFIAYQLYRFVFTHSIWLLVLTAIDTVIVVMIWQENRVLKNKSK